MKKNSLLFLLTILLLFSSCAKKPVISITDGLISVELSEKAGDIIVSKDNKSITIPIKADVNLAEKLPTINVAKGYTISLSEEGGKDLNSTLIYIISKGDVIEKWLVNTLEVYDGVQQASQLSTMSIFSENMVLQRDKPIKIWGTCKDAAVVTAEFAGQKKRAAVVKDRWEVTFNPLSANAQPQKLTVNAGGKIFEVNNIFVGDVWLCSGQSNMDLQIKSLSSQAQEPYNALTKNDNIKIFRVNRTNNQAPLKEFTEPCTWSVPSAEEMPNYSAYAYAFANRLETELDIPIGIVDSSYGGTHIEHWMTAKALAAAGTSYGESMFNPMINPFAGMSIKGILWYQGESNVMVTTSYEKLFTEYAKLYRSIFNDENLPIVTTQLPKCSNPNYPLWHEFRLTQWKIAESIPNVYVVCGIDLGGGVGISLHPNDKLPFGIRAGELTLNKIYSKNTPGISPYPLKAELSGNKVILTFKDAESGLEIRDGDVRELFLIASDDTAVRATAKITSLNTIEVSADGVTAPKAVQYCYSVDPNGNLVAKNGLPVAPFNIILD